MQPQPGQQSPPTQANIVWGPETPPSPQSAPGAKTTITGTFTDEHGAAYTVTIGYNPDLLRQKYGLNQADNIEDLIKDICQRQIGQGDLAQFAGKTIKATLDGKDVSVRDIGQSEFQPLNQITNQSLQTVITKAITAFNTTFESKRPASIDISVQPVKDKPPKSPEKPKSKNKLFSKFSQGQVSQLNPDLSDEVGKVACTSICGEVVKHLAARKKIETSQDIDDLIVRGVKAHGNNTLPAETKDILEKMNPFEILVPLTINTPSQGNVKDDFIYSTEKGKNNLELFKETREDAQQAYALFIFQKGDKNEQIGHTVLVYFDENDKLALFDSHGRNNRGASLQKFKNEDDLSNYFNKQYVGWKFTMDIIGTKNPSVEVV